MVQGLLRGPDLRRLLAVRLLGQGGDGLFQGALVGAAFFDPDSATGAAAAAGAFAALLLPYSVVGPFAGVLLDRWSRQRVLLVANLLRGGLLLGVAATLAATGPTSGATLGVALVTVSLNRFVLSGLSAALPHVVDEARLVTANAFTTTLGAGAAAVGGAVSLGLREVFGKTSGGAARTAVVAAVVYALAGLAATRIAPRQLGPDVTPPPLVDALREVARGLRAGVRHLLSRPQAAAGLAAMTAHRFWYGLSFVATLLLTGKGGALGGGLLGFGAVLAATVLGGLVAALVTPRATRLLGLQRWVVVTLAAAAVTEAALITPYSPAPYLVAAFLLGVSAQGAKISVDTIVQEQVDDAFRGRVFSVYDTLFNVAFVGAAAAAALLLPDDGRSVVAALVVAAGYALTAGLYARASRPAAVLVHH